MKSQLLSDFRFPVEFIMPTEDAFTIRSSPSFPKCYVKIQPESIKAKYEMWGLLNPKQFTRKNVYNFNKTKT